MRNKKLFSCILALTILCLLLCIPGFALEPSDSFYIADYAGVVSSSTEKDILNYNAELESTCDGAQMVFVLVDYIGNTPSDEYALQLMNDWGVGGSANNGMLLVASTQEKRGWLMQGSGLANSFTDEMCSDFLDSYFWPYFDDGEYDDAVSTLAENLYNWYTEFYGVSTDAGVASGAVPAQQPADSAVSVAGIFKLVLSVLVIIVLVFAFIAVLLSSGSGRRYGGYRRGYRGGFFPFIFFPGWFHRPPPPPGGPWGPGPHQSRPGSRPPHPPRGFGSGGGGGRRGGGFGGFGGGMGHGGGGFGSGGGGGRR